MAETSTPAQGKQKTGAEKAAQDTAQEVQNVKDSDPTGGGILDAIVIKVDGTVDGNLYEESSGETYVTLNKDVLEEFFYPDTKRPAYRVLYTAGQVVKKSAIDAYNAEVARKAAEADLEGDELVRAHIDQNTLASGTYPGVEQEKVDAARK